MICRRHRRQLLCDRDYTVTLNTRATASNREEDISSSISRVGGVAAVSNTAGSLDDSSNYSA
jgi:hypothetical protein